MLRSIPLTILTLLLLAACGEKPEASPPAAGTDTADRSAGNTADMHASEGTPDDGGMMAGMQTMGALSGDSMRALLPTHRQRAANMLAQMNREMQDMNMPADAAWTATVDSLRDDLIRMPAMSSDQLRALMPRHHARMTRLMEMHREMMGNMQM